MNPSPVFTLERDERRERGKNIRARFLTLCGEEKTVKKRRKEMKANPSPSNFRRGTSSSIFPHLRSQVVKKKRAKGMRTLVWFETKGTRHPDKGGRNRRKDRSFRALFQGG